MNLPFVSRSHFEDIKQELAEQKALNRELLTRMGAIAPNIPQQVAEIAKEAEETPDPISPYVGRYQRMSQMRQRAEKQLMEKFKEKYPVTAELEAIEAQGRSLAHGS